MPSNFYGAVDLTGGGTGALDAIDGADLADLDAAFVVTTSLLYTYSLDVDSAVGESSPAIISPDDNAGDKRWILVGVSSTNPVGGDGTAGRVLRKIYLSITDGTNADTLKCTVGSRWNGDIIAQTDNVALNATTGNFTLSADGTELKIEAVGLAGNVLFALGNLTFNTSTTSLFLTVRASVNDIFTSVKQNSDGVAQDLTTLVDAVGGSAQINFDIFYITDV